MSTVRSLRSVTVRNRGIAALIGIVVTGASLSGCASDRATDSGSSADSSSRSEALPTGARGRHVAALDFSVPSTTARVTPTSRSLVPTSAAEATSGAGSADQAVDAFLTSLLSGDAAAAWNLVDEADRVRINVPDRLRADAAPYGWSSFTVEGTDGADVLVRLVQRPKISDIDGVIASRSTLTLPSVERGGRYFVVWSRRSVVQEFPERSDASDRDVTRAVMSWAVAQQHCEAPPHDGAGLLGVVGLADALCGTTAQPRFDGVGDLDSLDDPQPIIDAFGGSALQWARVVPMRAPLEMAVVVAPDGPSWMVVGVARASLRSNSVAPRTALTTTAN